MFFTNTKQTADTADTTCKKTISYPHSRILSLGTSRGNYCRLYHISEHQPHCPSRSTANREEGIPKYNPS
jgi:hypothetical protein